MAEDTKLTAEYRRWDCLCGPEPTVTLSWGPRPATLLGAFPWPPRDVRCRCGGILNRIMPDECRSCGDDYQVSPAGQLLPSGLCSFCEAAARGADPPSDED